MKMSELATHFRELADMMEKDEDHEVQLTIEGQMGIEEVWGTSWTPT